MGDRIRVTGPIRDWVDDANDDGDLVGGGFYQKAIFVEATGTDGIVYAKSYAFSDTVEPEYIPRFIEGGKKILQWSMEADGVW